VKLLTISPYFESHRGGVEIVAGRLARELADRGLDVTWLASDVSPASGAPASVGLGVWNIAERRLGIPYPLPTPRSIAAIVRQVRSVDAVLVHDSLYATSVVAVLAARWSRRPILLVQHIGQIPYRNRVARSIMALANTIVARTVLRSVDQVVFISDTTAQFFSRVRLRRPALMIYNGVDTEVFRPAQGDERASLRRELGLSPDRPQALFVGRFVEKKGLRYLEALAKLRPDVDWLFAGWGQIDPEAWKQPNVRVFSQLSGPSLADLYRACDLFVLPSVGEGFPLVVQEALATGLAVVCGSEVARADPAAASWLTGVELTGDIDAVAASLSAAIDRIFRDVQPSHTVERARFAASRYAWEAIADRYRETLDLLMRARTQPVAGRADAADAPASVAP
jgi:glycosyltransferase involved in cell wall biosynthesis